MSDTVTLRVLISKKELDELKAIVAHHENHCKQTPSEENVIVNDASVKAGAGEVSIGPGGDTNPNPLPSFTFADKEDTFDVRNGIISDKDILLPGATKVLLPEKKDSLSKEKESPISNPNILSKIRKRYQKRALRLLNELAKHPMAVSYDNHGVVTINGTLIEKSSIQDLLASTFYAIHSSTVIGLSMWIDMLKEKQLYSYIINPELKEKNYDHHWYYIGNLT